MITRDPKVKEEGVSLIAAVFIPDEKSLVRVASLKSGAKPIFEDVASNFLSLIQCLSSLSVSTTWMRLGNIYPRYF